MVGRVRVAGLVVVASLVGVAALALPRTALAETEAPVAESQPADVTESATPSAEVLDAIDELKQNREEILAQQRSEQEAARDVLTLPPGAEFSEPDTVRMIDSQISALEAPNGSALLDLGEYPLLSWYEEGFFASLLAIDWKCAWLSTGVMAVESGDSTAAAESVEVLRSFVDTPDSEAFVDYDYFLENQVEPLLDGDTSGAEQYLPSCAESTIVE